MPGLWSSSEVARADVPLAAVFQSQELNCSTSTRNHRLVLCSDTAGTTGVTFNRKELGPCKTIYLLRPRYYMPPLLRCIKKTIELQQLQAICATKLLHAKARSSMHSSSDISYKAFAFDLLSCAGNKHMTHGILLKSQ